MIRWQRGCLRLFPGHRVGILEFSGIQQESSSNFTGIDLAVQIKPLLHSRRLGTTLLQQSKKPCGDGQTLKIWITF